MPGGLISCFFVINRFKGTLCGLHYHNDLNNFNITPDQVDQDCEATFIYFAYFHSYMVHVIAVLFGHLQNTNGNKWAIL